MGSRSVFAVLIASWLALAAPRPSSAAGAGKAPEGATERVPQLTPVTIRHANGRSSTKTLVPGELVPIAHDRPMFYLYRGGTELLIEQKGPVFSVRVDRAPVKLAGVRAGVDRRLADPRLRKALAQAGVKEVVEDEIAAMAALKDALAQRVSPLTITCRGETLKSLPPIPRGVDVALVVQGDDLGGLAPFVARCPGLTALSVMAQRWVPESELLRTLTELTTLELWLQRPFGLDALRGGEPDAEPARSLEDIAPLASLSRLRVLRLQGRVHPSDTKPLARLKHLVSLRLDHVGKGGDLTFLGGLTNLERLRLGNCDHVTDLSPLARLERLAELTLYDCRVVEDISPLAKLGNLTYLLLEVDKRAKLDDLSPLANLSKLKELRIHGLAKVTDLRPLASLRGLKKLTLGAMEHVGDLGPIGKLANLEELSLSSAPGIHDIRPLGNLTHLATLSLAGFKTVTDLAPLQKLGKLESLTIHYLSRVTDVGPLAGLAALRRLHVSQCAELRDFTPLARLPNLVEVTLSHCDGLRDLSPLARLPRLRVVKLHGCANATDLGPLRHFVKRGGKLIHEFQQDHPKVKRLREGTDF